MAAEEESGDPDRNAMSMMYTLLFLSGDRERIKYYEQKVLQTESERLQKEKENLQLKESISRLRRELMERDRELKRNESSGEPRMVRSG